VWVGDGVGYDAILDVVSDDLVIEVGRWQQLLSPWMLLLLLLQMLLCLSLH